MNIPVSVFIITLNEEHNISRVLSSISEFDEVIVVDSGSTDNTKKIANEFGATVSHQDWLGYAMQKQHAMSLCKHDWVLNLDADEEIPLSLLDEIKLEIKEDSASAMRFKRNDFFLNKKYPSLCKLPSNVRLYKKSKARFDRDCLVHESAKVDGKEITLKAPFLHYGYNDINTLTDKQNEYSSLKAHEKFVKGKSFSYLKLTLIFPVEFIKKFFLQRYFLFGFRGFILSIMNANYAIMKEAKLYGLHKSK